MNQINKFLLVFTVITIGCSQSLDEEVFDEVTSNNFFRNDNDAITAVNAIYTKLRGAGVRSTEEGQAWGLFAQGFGPWMLNQYVSDETWVTWALSFPSGDAGVLQNFTFTPFQAGGGIFYVYRDFYEGINIANNVILNVENNSDISQPVRDQVMGEALFGRGMFYYYLYNFYGKVPLVLKPTSDPFSLPSQASESELVESIASDLSRAGELLPVSYPLSDYGRFTKGAAYSLLARLYLNEKRWADAETAARMIMNDYTLSSGYSDIFAPDNNGNPEILFSVLSIAQTGLGNAFLAATAEPDQVTASWGGDRVYQAFYESFDPEDIRRELLTKSYISVFDSSQVILDDEDGALIMKYAVDENRIGPWAGNDIVVLRFTDVILVLAEALNEIHGPNQESIDLINWLRQRAFPGNPGKLLNLGDFSSKEELRDRILQERSWELYAEGYRREDLIRHGKFIERAKERGIDAGDHQVLYPIPQYYIDINPNLLQNPGY